MKPKQITMVLDALTEWGPATSRDIAEVTSLSVGNVSSLLGDLEACGLARRKVRLYAYAPRRDTGRRGGRVMALWEVMPQAEPDFTLTALSQTPSATDSQIPSPKAITDQ